jgi:LPS export ABC transporter protein LptC
MPSVSSINRLFDGYGRGLRMVVIFRMLVMLVIVTGQGCEDKAKQVVSHGPHQLVPEEGDSISAYLSEAGLEMGTLQAKVKGKLTAPYMLRYQRLDSPYFEFPRTLHVDFFKDSINVSEKPVIESKLDALYGKYLQNQSKVYLRDSVVVKNILKGDTLHAKYLWWDQNTEKFTTDDSVRINEPDKTLFGTGMEADQNFRYYKIRKLTGIILTSGNNIPK